MGLLTGIIKHFFAWLFTLIALGLLIVLVPLTLGLFRRYGAEPLLRIWGKGMLLIAGVKLEKEGLEFLKERECRILTINHTSSLDLFIISSIAPNGSIHIIKKEARFLPIIGLAAWLLGVQFLDRSNKERAIKGLKEVAERMQRERGTVCIAPEGTRSKDGNLQPFKLGVFHLALASRATIYPILIDGAYKVWPRSAWFSRRGTVKVRVLEPMDSADFTEDNLREKAEMMRERYAEALHGQQKTSDS